MELRLFQVDAFASEVFHGNPAGVVPLRSWPDDAVLQAIAAENNQSETAFFVPRGADYDLRWFTPELEMDLCGHATLASAFVRVHPARAPARGRDVPHPQRPAHRGARGRTDGHGPAVASGPALRHPRGPVCPVRKCTFNVIARAGAGQVPNRSLLRARGRASSAAQMPSLQEKNPLPIHSGKLDNGRGRAGKDLMTDQRKFNLAMIAGVVLVAAVLASNTVLEPLLAGLGERIKRWSHYEDVISQKG